MFFGGSCLLQLDIPKNNGGKLGLSATGGVAVFIFTYMYPPYWYSPSSEPDKNVSVSIHSDNEQILKDVDVTYRIGGRTKSASGSQGIAAVTVPAQTETIQEIRVSIPCYAQASTGPFKVVEGRDIKVPLQKVTTPTPDPLPPTAYPDPRNLIPSNEWPSPHVLADYKPTPSPDTFVFQHENLTDELAHLMLFNFARHANSQDPWRVIHADPCDSPNKFSGFQESKGIFAIIAMKRDLSPPVYLGTVDLYAKPLTKLRLKSTDSVLSAEIIQE